MTYKDYLNVKKEYEKQKRLEEYQQYRCLDRPKTNCLHVIIFSLLYVIIIAVIITVFVHTHNYLLEIVPLIISMLLFSEIYLRFLGIKIVECYQHYAKEETRRRCLCIPSCSEYAIACLKRYTLIIALIKIRKRLFVTCKGYIIKIDYPC